MEMHITQIHLLLVLVFLTGVLAGDWSVNVPSGVCTVVNSSVVLPCSYDFPQSRDGQEVQVKSEMWCLGDKRCVTPRYVYHSAAILQEPAFQSRVQYLGRLGSKDCSLRISGLRESDSGTYVFYLITNHSTEKMPAQRGLQLLVTGSRSEVLAVSDPVIMEAEPVTLSCCSHAPNAEVLWFKSSSSEPQHTGAKWTISKSREEDSGGYYCQVQTEGQVHRSKELLLDVQYAPRSTSISMSPPEQPEAGRPVNLTCSSEAKPAVLTYSWYRGAACASGADLSLYKAVQSSATEAAGGGGGGGITLSTISISFDPNEVHCCVSSNLHGSQKSSLPTSTTSAGTMVLIGVTVAVLLVLIACIAFFLKRKKKSSRNQSYALAPTASAQP